MPNLAEKDQFRLACLTERLEIAPDRSPQHSSEGINRLCFSRRPNVLLQPITNGKIYRPPDPPLQLSSDAQIRE